MSREWERYEQVTAELLNLIANEFGVARFEGKQTIPGASGTDWEIDAKGVTEGGERIVVVEMRNTKARQSQAKVGALAFTLLDTGSDGGIIVSALPLQAGAKKVAAHAGVHHVQIDAGSTLRQFAMKILNKLFMGVTVSATARAEASCVVRRVCKECGQRFLVAENESVCPACANT